MPFSPEFCPRPDCCSHAGAPFDFQCRGSFRRFCDQRVVRRFTCRACRRGFSEQTFRVDYRLKRPELLPLLFVDRISKVTHRQSARNQVCARTTEERHFRRIALHCEAFHEQRLKRFGARGGEMHDFVFDELETYEQNRTRKPVTAGVVVEGNGFVVGARVGTLAPRKAPGRGKRHAPPQEPTPGERTSDSRAVVRSAFELVRELSGKTARFSLRTDLKPSYATVKDEVLGERCNHQRTSSRRRRDVTNPLWPINHTFARVRDGISRLVRETWAASKKREWLRGHLAIWICYRNYVRGRTNRAPAVTPAMALGVVEARLSAAELLERRVFPWDACTAMRGSITRNSGLGRSA